jgi:hypothetical protein
MPIGSQVTHNHLLEIPINLSANPISLLANLNLWDHPCIILVSLLATPNILQAIPIRVLVIPNNLLSILVSLLAIPNNQLTISIRMLASPVSHPARVTHMWVTPIRVLDSLISQLTIFIRMLGSHVSQLARVTHMWVSPILQWASNSTRVTLTMVSNNSQWPILSCTGNLAMFRHRLHRARAMCNTFTPSLAPRSLSAKLHRVLGETWLPLLLQRLQVVSPLLHLLLAKSLVRLRTIVSLAV